MAIKESKQCFVNPYHFVQLDPQGCLRESCDDVRGPLSGWIECSLTTLTPLFVPNSSNDDILRERDRENNPIKSYDFFSYTDLSTHTDDSNPPPPCPVIPGSELRGVIRSVYETLTRSCMSSVDDDKPFYRRTPVPGKPGLLSKVGGHWQLQSCRRYGIEKTRMASALESLTDGERIWIRLRGREVGDIKTTHMADDSYKEGFFHRADMPEEGNKHHESVFVTQQGSWEIEQEDVDRLSDNIGLYKHDKGNFYDEYSRLVASCQNIPVYYWKRGSVLYLSPAAVGREVFKNRIGSILSQGGQYKPCTDVARLCPACRLFGMVGGGNSSAAAGVAGRVRFSDAMLKKKPDDLGALFHDWVYLPELASPKPSAAEFYLQRTDAHLWNYDYMANWQRKLNGELKRNSLSVLPNYHPAIRGRKYYWHQHLTDPPQQSDTTATKRNVYVRCLRLGQTFAFRVYFDKVTREELNRLLWVLSIGGRMTGDRPTHALKIGMGKPLGLGSVRVIPEKVVIRELKKDGGISYNLIQNDDPLAGFDWTTPEKELALLGCSLGVRQDFLCLTDWEQAPGGVDYPHTEEHPHDESYQWFVDNMLVESGSAFTPVINQSLPSNPAQPELKKYREQ